jgi:hypothetical protein
MRITNRDLLRCETIPLSREGEFDLIQKYSMYDDQSVPVRHTACLDGLRQHFNLPRKSQPHSIVIVFSLVPVAGVPTVQACDLAYAGYRAAKKAGWTKLSGWSLLTLWWWVEIIT